MKSIRLSHILASFAAALLTCALQAKADTAPPDAGAATDKMPLLDLSAANLMQRWVPDHASESQVGATLSTDAAAPGVVVSVQPGEAEYPGINFKPDGAAWDLSKFGHVEAKIVNTGEKPLNISLRVDNNGDWSQGPFNCESIYIKPGATGKVTVIFGYSYGKQKSYALKSDAVANILMFAGKSKEAQSFRVESIDAAGPAGETPPIDPNSIRIAPPGGVMLGSDVTIDAKKQIVDKETQSSLAADGLHIDFAASDKPEQMKLQSPQGRWDLRQALEVRVKIKNNGSADVAPVVHLDSNGGPTDTITAAPIAAGAEAEVVVPFTAVAPWQGIKNSGDRSSPNGQPDTGTRFTSDAVSGVVIGVKDSSASQSLTVESIVADVPPPEALPDWLGKKPPVDGDWVQTFDDEFDGNSIDQTKWNITGPNYWDKKSHWSKDNVTVSGGFATLTYEKKTGTQNDDPKSKSTPYASGYLDTYGKWVQRYGYFETRVKLPTAPGLWPAFWLMPDRGPTANPQWKRQDTANGGMEFDVMEYLSRWGPYRYNIAMHWDGYGKLHKATGSEHNYVRPDKDGFITVGLLWTPGSAVYYCNGKEVLRWEDPRISTVQSDLMFTLPMGGWDNSPLDDAKLPDTFVIDYVRCWQRKDLASAVDGPQPAGADAR